MIIFDLDETLADCEHRRHFVDPTKNPEYLPIYAKPFDYMNPKTGKIFKPDWKAFYEACDQDKPIEPTIHILNDLRYSSFHDDQDIQIWTTRCESVREKTVQWLYENVSIFGGIPQEYHDKTFDKYLYKNILKMRPIGDNTPNDQLKEKWLLQYCYEANVENNNCNPIDFVFDSDQKSISMWRKYEIFVFNCGQQDEEF